jgi:hypothetical protein
MVQDQMHMLTLLGVLVNMINFGKKEIYMEKLDI